MRKLFSFMILGALVAPGAATAQGWIEPLPGRGGVVKVRTAVAVAVRGRVARVDVEEWFENRGGGLGEGDYLYPLPGEAVFSNFSLYQGDVELRGETMDAAQARGIYEEIVRRKKDPALIELAGHGLVRARVFPINPGETRKITMRYTQVLGKAGDALAFRYAAGGAFGGGQGGQGGQGGREGQVGPRPARDGAPLQFTMTVDSAGQFRDPFSPTHDVTVTRHDGRITVRPTAALSGDFALFLPFAERVVGLTLVTHRPSGEAGYFMLTLSPEDVRTGGAPRDLTVVVDVSGSMSGDKIEQARAALHQLLNSLRTTDRRSADRFRLIRFSSAVHAQAAEFTVATAASLREAHAWVDDLRADGGTNIAGALAEALRLESPEGRLPLVVFMTDGLPSVGEQNPERIAAQAEQERDDARLFAFGIGYDVNTYLLDRLSAAGRGTTEYVEPEESVEAAVGALVARIQHPVLTDLALDASVRVEEVYPERLPDLFAGDELVVFGRYAGASGEGRVAIRGMRAGRAERYATVAAFPATESGNDFIPRLWAARKIGVLQQSIRLNGPNPEIVEEIRQTALRYGLLSEYTSYLVQEPTVVADRAFRPGLPAAPMAQEASGAGAVGRAKRDAARRLARNEAELAAVDEEMLKVGHMGQAQHVAGRLFVEQDGIWTDLRHADSLRVVTVTPFSPAYFALLRALPELKPIVQRFDRVQVAGRAVTIRFDAGGLTREADVAALVARFRAS
jgi:Ca-activated chloride channel family protein